MSQEFGLNKPTPFDGNRKKIVAFIQEVKVYLTVNKHVYHTDESKIAFTLSYMTKNEALQWKELYVEQMMDANGELVFPSFKKFIYDLIQTFQPINRIDDAMNQLTMLKQGDRAAEELVMEFRLLMGRAGLEAKSHSDNLHLIGLFRDALNPQLARRILFSEVIPKTIEGWIAKAIQFDTNYRMAMAILKQTPETSQRDENRSRRWAYRPTERKDFDLMNIDKSMMEERSVLMSEGKCFKCKKRGHRARDCLPDRAQTTSTETKKKSMTKDLVSQMKTMTKEEKMELAEVMKGDGDDTDSTKRKIGSTPISPSLDIYLVVANVDSDSMNIPMSILLDERKTIETNSLLDRIRETEDDTRFSLVEET